MSNKKDFVITYTLKSKIDEHFCIDGRYLNSIVPVKFWRTEKSPKTKEYPLWGTLKLRKKRKQLTKLLVEIR
jgi:hypothetical protein